MDCFNRKGKQVSAYEREKNQVKPHKEEGHIKRKK